MVCCVGVGGDHLVWEGSDQCGSERFNPKSAKNKNKSPSRGGFFLNALVFTGNKIFALVFSVLQGSD